MKNILEYNVEDFFGDVFKNSYVCAMKEHGGQFEGCIPSRECSNLKEYNKLFEERFFPLNASCHGIHFTPNGMKDFLEKNRKENFYHANSYYIDVDIEETKTIKTGDDLLLRQEKKNRVLGKIFSSPIWPSMIVETRNGYHLYWWCADNPSLEEWREIQHGLLQYYSDVTKDDGVLNECMMLRIPYFKYHKKGETGFIKIDPNFSTAQKYAVNQMKYFYPYEEVIELEVSPKKENKPLFLRSSMNEVDNLLNLPVKEVIEKISGTEIVKFDKFSFTQITETKLNIRSNNQNTPNWIDIEKNKIFSNNIEHFCNIIHFLKWYGHSLDYILQYFKNNVTK